MSETNPDNKVVISAALVGAFTKKEQNPNVPYSPEEYAEEVKKCYDAGAAIVHLHMRDPNTGDSTADLGVYEVVLGAIRGKCPEILINLSTAVGIGSTEDERAAPIAKFKPDLASLNSASMNFAMGDWKTGNIIIEIIFENDFKLISRLAKIMKDVKIKPEIEIYDFGGMYNIDFLKRGNLFEEPLHFQFVFGVLGGIPFSIANLSNLLQLKPPEATWSVCGVANQQFQAALCAASMDGHIRVGLEDNVRSITGELAKGSWEQVEWAANVSKLAGREPATPDEARKILNLPK